MKIEPTEMNNGIAVITDDAGNITYIDADDWAYKTLTDEGMIRVCDLCEEELQFILIPLIHRFEIEDIINAT